MRYELTDYEWAATRPMLPNKARGVPRADDRRVSSTASAGCCDPAHHSAAGLLWPMHHLLQPFRAMAKGRSVGADHGRACCRS
jgi:hypothetical protein